MPSVPILRGLDFQGIRVYRRTPEFHFWLNGFIFRSRKQLLDYGIHEALFRLGVRPSVGEMPMNRG